MGWDSQAAVKLADSALHLCREVMKTMFLLSCHFDIF